MHARGIYEKFNRIHTRLRSAREERGSVEMDGRISSAAAVVVAGS